VIKTGDAPVLDGPLGQVNWRAIGAGVPAAGAWEFAFYSDAHVTGEVLERLGPFIMAALDAGVPL